MSIATKVFVAFAAVIATFLLVLGFSITQMQTTYAEMRSVNQVIVPLSLAVSDLQTDLKGFSLVLNEKDPLVLRRTLQVTRIGPSLTSRFQHKIDTATGLISSATPENRLQTTQQRVNDIATTIEAFAKEAEAFSVWVLENEGDEIQVRQAALLDSARQIDEQLTGLRNDLRLITDRGLARAKSLERSSLYALGASTAVALLVAIGLLAVVVLNLRPLAMLTDAVRRVGGGELNPIELPQRSGRDEVKILSEEFNAMVVSLKERDAAIRDQHARLIQSERMATVGQMTSVITHELRNPLSSINLNSEMLMDAIAGGVDTKNHDEVVALLESIIGEVDRLRDITESYLGYSKIPEPKLADADLVEILGNLIDFHEWEWAQDFSVTIAFESEIDRAPVHVDANQIRQALLNLVKNAVEVSPKDSSVSVAVVGAGESWEVRVTDVGPGIAADVIDRLFTPFFTTKSGGTGLGLAVTQQIVEDHGGELRVDSVVGEGATFTATFSKVES